MTEKYIVTKREVWAQDVEIEAESEQEAIRLVNNGEGEHLSEEFTYSHNLDDETTAKAAPILSGLTTARRKINQETKYTADISTTNGDKIIIDCDFEDIQPSTARTEIESIIGTKDYDIHINSGLIEIRLK